MHDPTALALTQSASSPLVGHDLVTIRNLRVWSLIGVHPHEREGQQEIRVDAWLATDTAAAAAGDDLSRAIDYSKVCEAFRKHASSAAHLLIESLAEDFSRLALDDFGALAVRISIEKTGAVPGTDSVGVIIERPRP